MTCRQIQLIPFFPRQRNIVHAAIISFQAFSLAVPVTSCIFAGWRRIHAAAIVVSLTPYFSASTRIFLVQLRILVTSKGSIPSMTASGMATTPEA